MCRRKKLATIVYWNLSITYNRYGWLLDISTNIKLIFFEHYVMYWQRLVHIITKYQFLDFLEALPISFWLWISHSFATFVVRTWETRITKELGIEKMSRNNINHLRFIINSKVQKKITKTSSYNENLLVFGCREFTTKYTTIAYILV